MVVLGGLAVSYERGTPALRWAHDAVWRRAWGRRASRDAERLHGIQGYLTHRKHRRARTLQKGYAYGSMVVLISQGSLYK